MAMQMPNSGPPVGPPAGMGAGPAGPGPAASGLPIGAPPPGMMPPGQAVPAPPQQASALTSAFQDVSIHLPHHYQLLDVAASTIEQALNTGGFSTEPKNQAAVKSIHGQLTQLIANRTREGQLAASTPAPSLEPSGGEHASAEDEGEGLQEQPDAEA